MGQIVHFVKKNMAARCVGTRSRSGGFAGPTESPFALRHMECLQTGHDEQPARPSRAIAGISADSRWDFGLWGLR